MGAYQTYRYGNNMSESLASVSSGHLHVLSHAQAHKRR